MRSREERIFEKEGGQWDELKTYSSLQHNWRGGVKP